MNNQIKTLVVLLLLLNPIHINAQTANTDTPITIQLTGNQTQVIQNNHYYITGGINLQDNSSLTIINATLTFTQSEEDTYTVMGSSTLKAVNTTIMLSDPWSIQVSENASITLTGTDMYTGIQTGNTLYRTGIGASGATKITVIDSRLGFIRLSDTASCTVENSYIGDFGSQSLYDPMLTGCTLERISFVYENTWVQVNESLVGYHTWFNQSQLVKSGQTLYDVTILNTTMLYPPNISVSDGKLETHDTELDMVQISGDSAIESQNTEIYYLQLWDYSWAFIDDSTIEYLVAWNGDFNIRLKNTTHRAIGTYGTTGLNLKLKHTTTEQLVLDWAQPNTPQNVELHDTYIGNLDINMYSPNPIQCNDATIGNLTLTAGWGTEEPRVITGTVDFTEDAQVNQLIEDGYTCIKRVYLIHATIDEAPAAETQLTIQTSNGARTITTNQDGEAVLSVTYLRHIEETSNMDNLTSSVTITLNNQNTTIGLLSNAPVTIKAVTQSNTEQPETNWSQYAPSAILLALIAVAVYLFNSRRSDEENRQIQ